MKRCLELIAAVLCCVIFSTGLSYAPAAEKADSQKSATQKTATELLPASTIAYAQLSQPKLLLDLILEHPLRQRVEQLDQVRKAMQGKQFKQFQAIVQVIEQQIGMKWNEAFGRLTAEGISIGYDSKTQGVALLLQAKDQETLDTLRDKFFKLVRDEAQRKGNADPIKTTEYRGITAYSLGQAKFATLGPLLVVVNNDKLGKIILDNYLDDNSNSLSDNDRFQTARKTISGEPTIWGYLDVATLRDSNPDNDIYKKKNSNVILELLIGGLSGTAQNTPYLTSTLDIEKHRITLNISAPHDPAWVGIEREYFFGPDGKGTAPALLKPKETLFSLSTYRNFSDMWMNSADIFTEKVDAGFAKASATLATLFSGKDFGEEVLGAFQGEVQIVAVRQQFDEKRPIPAIKLPSFAIVFRFKEAEKVKADFRRMFQSLIGFINITGAQKGQPQLDLDMEKQGEHQIITATYAPDTDKKISQQVKINFNFSPSVAFAGETFIISSTKQLARELVDLVAAPQPAQQQSKKHFTTNTRIKADSAVIREAVNDNRKQLISRTILSEGKERAEAEKQVDLILEAVGSIEDINLHLGTNKKNIQLELEINLAK